MKVRNGVCVGGGERDGERERVVLPDVVGGERRESGEDLEVERLELLLGCGGRREGGERKVGVDGVEDGVVGKCGVVAGERVVGELVCFRCHFQGFS